MWKRLCALALALSLAASLSPAHAAEGSDIAARFPAVRIYEGFDDVQETDWYAPYVQVCYETGLMDGTEDGQFSPNRELSFMEIIVLTARLYALSQGMDGIPSLSLPEDPQNLLRFYDADGTQVGNFSDLKGTDMAVHTPLFIDLEPEFLERIDRTQPLTLTIEDYASLFAMEPPQNGLHTYTGTYAELDTEIFGLRQGYFFEHGKDDLHAMIMDLSDFVEFNCSASDSYRDASFLLTYAAYTENRFDLLGSVFSEEDNIAAGNTIEAWETTSCLRQHCAVLLYCAVDPEDFPAINQVERVPDMENEGILALYRAGILTGTDSYGTFHGRTPLTRAEAAAMLARIVRPELRVPFTPEPLTDS